MILPIQDMVLLERDEVPQKTDGGIHIPQGDYEDHYRGAIEGKVIAVGPGLMLECGRHSGTEIEPGDRVLYLKMLEVEVPQAKGVFTKYENILGVIEDG